MHSLPRLSVAGLSPLFLLAAALTADARAQDIALPPGFNVETQPGPGSLATILPDGKVLLSTGSFGADELSLRQPNGGLTLFADGFGSFGGIAQSPVTGDIVVGDSFSATALHVLRDLNLDGDALDGGEHTVHPAALPVLSNGLPPLPFELSFRPGTDELYLSGSSTNLQGDVAGAVVRVVGGSATVFAEGLGYAGGMAWEGATLYATGLDPAFFVGRVVTLTDGNADDDALDIGESVDFAAGLSGASDLVRASDGSFYLSGTFAPPTFSSTVTRLLPDADNSGQSDGVDEGWIGGFGFTANLTLIEGPGGLQPGVAGDGTLVVQDFGGFPAIDKVVRSEPVATLALNGTVQNNAAFDLVVGGEPGAGAIAVLSLDQGGVTLYGIGDLSLGFGAPHLILPLAPIGGTGTSTLHIVLHGMGNAVGLAFTMQGFTLQDGRVGISNAIDAVVAP